MSYFKKIFVLEDNEVDIEVLKAHMKSFSVSISHAATISEAKKQFDVDKYDAAILDWNLPDGIGKEFAEHIRTFSDNFRIVFLSGTLDDDIIDQASRYKALGCFAKNYGDDFAPEILKLFFS